jgi:hypothetical protein
MAIPKQTFRIFIDNGRYVDTYHNYFIHLINEKEALEQYCKIMGYDTNGLRAEEIKEERT